jgi:hypothetical protein
MAGQSCMSTYQPQIGNGKTWCSITHDYFEPENIAPAHIVPAGLALEIMDYMFSPEQALAPQPRSQPPLHQHHGQDFIRQGRPRHRPRPN